VKWWSVFLPILLLCVVSCARARHDETKDQPPPQPATAPERADDREVTDRDAGEVVSKREITLNQAAPADQPQLATTQQSEQQRLLALESVQVLPEDFKIGPLADLVGADRSTLEMITVATRFLEALQDGAVDGESLLAEVRQELTTSIRYYLEQDLIPVNYRIGAITTESYAEGDQAQSPLQHRTAWMNLRLFGSPGVSEGELYLERSAGRWYVSDLQIDFERMSREYVREEEVYYPSTYGWGIQ
jgi:hypothetical protein